MRIRGKAGGGRLRIQKSCFYHKEIKLSIPAEKQLEVVYHRSCFSRPEDFILD